MRGKSEDLPVGVPERRKSRFGTVHHGARARSGVYMVRLRGRAWCALGSSWFFCFSCGAEPNGPTAEEHCSSRFATSVESFSPGPGPTFGQAALPGVVLGPPHGLGDREGSLDVVTLGNGGTITLGFAPSNVAESALLG